MTIPRFSAELAVYRSAKPYQGGVRAFTVRPSDVIPALRPECLGLGLACAIAVFDGVPFDEYPICGAFAAQCSGAA